MNIVEMTKKIVVFHFNKSFGDLTFTFGWADHQRVEEKEDWNALSNHFVCCCCHSDLIIHKLEYLYAIRADLTKKFQKNIVVQLNLFKLSSFLWFFLFNQRSKTIKTLFSFFCEIVSVKISGTKPCVGFYFFLLLTNYSPRLLKRVWHFF